MTAIPQSYKPAERNALASWITNRVRPTTLWLIGCGIVCAWFVIVPLAALFYTAFTEDTGFGPGPFTLGNFKEAFGHASILKLIGNSIVFATGTAVLTFLMGGAVAAVVERTDAPGKSIFHTLALVS